MMYMSNKSKKNITNTTSKVSKILSLTLLLGITVISNSYTSESLRNLFDDSNNIVNFDRSTIKLNTVDNTDVINSEEFVIDSGNNTTYIDMNTLPIQNSIGGGGSISKYNW